MKLETVKTNAASPAYIAGATPRGLCYVNVTPTVDSSTFWLQAKHHGRDKLPAVACGTLGAALALGRVVLS